jgi:arylsulfatase A-like enzyme
MDAAEPSPRPNIIFILLDDLPWDALGCTGHPIIKAPGIDRIAREGATFRNAFVTTPLCFRSRASFLTGQHAHRHGIKLGDDRARLSHQMVTFPLLLQRGGYHTAFVGKWHLGNDEKPAPGVDRWVSFKEQGEYVDPDLNIDGHFQKTKGYLTDLLADHAVEFVKQTRTEPFMLYLSHKALHAPFTPAQRHSISSRTLRSFVPRASAMIGRASRCCGVPVSRWTKSIPMSPPPTRTSAISCDA